MRNQQHAADHASSYCSSNICEKRQCPERLGCLREEGMHLFNVRPLAHMKGFSKEEAELSETSLGEPINFIEEQRIHVKSG